MVSINVKDNVEDKWTHDTQPDDNEMQCEAM